jgi:hypothetical protein
VLSHPILADAIENEFVAAAVFNSVKDGEKTADARALVRFREPAWNNPVVRFVDSLGNDLLPRRDGVYAPFEIGARLVAALEAARHPVPEYLRLAVEELDPRPRSLATFEMHCFWEGEARLGALPGVLATRPGFLGGKEVVEVTFDPRTLPFARLAADAKQFDCARGVFAHDAKDVANGVRLAPGIASDTPESDRKHALASSPLRFLPLSQAQSARLNAAVASGGSIDEILSPRQRQMAETLLEASPAALAKLEVPPRSIEAFAETARRIEAMPR